MRRQRHLGLSAVIMAVGLILGACGGGGGESEPAAGGGGQQGGGVPEELGGTLVISNWDAYMPEKLIPSFEKKTGVEVEVAVHTTN
jgi:spermidine/putrescine-binding protein